MGKWAESMRLRIHEMRSLLEYAASKRVLKQDFSVISKQQGMFSFSVLRQTKLLSCVEEKYGIYIVGSAPIKWWQEWTSWQYGPHCVTHLPPSWKINI